MLPLAKPQAPGRFLPRASGLARRGAQMSGTFEALSQLADAYHLETTFYDDQGHLVQATPDALLLVLQTLGASLAHVDQAEEALRLRRIEQWQRVLEPVAVAWEGSGAAVSLRLPTREASGTLGCR